MPVLLRMQGSTSSCSVGLLLPVYARRRESGRRRLALVDQRSSLDSAARLVTEGKS